MNTLDAARADAVAAAAAETAREALVADVGAAMVGEHLGASGELDRVVTHRFASLLPGYRGWVWAVTVSRAPRGRSVSVDEIVQLPGDDALVAPPWVPWSQRLQPGDVGPGDLLPADPDDDRLEPGWLSTPDDEPDVMDVVRQFGLDRARVLSPLGRDDAMDRWLNGPGGPFGAVAEGAPATCESCGFLVRLGGSFGRWFGACSNEWSPDDGRVVSLDHGCGAHSEAAAREVARHAHDVGTPVIDETVYDLVSTRAPAVLGEDELVLDVTDLDETDLDETDLEDESETLELGHS